MNPGLDERVAEPIPPGADAEAPITMSPRASKGDRATPAFASDKSGWYRELAGVLNKIAWFATVALFAAACLRTFDHDGTYALVWLNAFTRYIYMPAYVCLAWALWQRRWVLLFANLVIIVCHISWLAPDYERSPQVSHAVTNIDANADEPAALRIFFANVRADNSDKVGLLQEIEAANPDVALLVEFTLDWYAAFRAAPQMRPYKFGTGKSHARVGLVNVFSKLPLEDESQVFDYGRTLQTIDVPVGSRSLRIIGLHAPRPTSRIDNYENFWREAVPQLLAERGPLIVVGDFNATQYSRVYGQLTADHLRSAHEDRGRGYATTWPNGHNWLPPIRIDQALLSPDVECFGIAEGVGSGSDHKPLILDVRIRDPNNPGGPVIGQSRD